MKKLLLLFLCIALISLMCGCGTSEPPAQIVATTLPVYEFTSLLCEGTDLTVSRLVTEEVSCLHDYSLQTKQMRAIEAAQLVVISGAGLEEFLDDALTGAHQVIDASESVAFHHEHKHDHGEHHHEDDPHIWLSPANAKIMVTNICRGLVQAYPQYEDVFRANEQLLLQKLDALEAYGHEQLASLSSRELITFHDGFGYFAQAYDLTILRTVEEESGSEASAAELIDLIELVEDHSIRAIFTERSGSTSAAQIISRETGALVFTLDMAMSGESYFDAMYHNIDTVKEALG